MATIASTRMSSKGQVVIPEAIRRQLGLEPGTLLVAVAEGDVVILKAVIPPSAEECAPLIAQAQRVEQSLTT